MRSDFSHRLEDLHASLAPAWKVEGQSPIGVSDLIARSSSISERIGGALAFFDLRREWIVKGFSDLTVGKMHRILRRTYARITTSE